MNCRKYLTEDILPFWLENAIDEEYGGIFTHLNQYGEVYCTEEKSGWFQALFYLRSDMTAAPDDPKLSSLQSAEEESSKLNIRNARCFDNDTEDVWIRIVPVFKSVARTSEASTSESSTITETFFSAV